MLMSSSRERPEKLYNTFLGLFGEKSKGCHFFALGSSILFISLAQNYTLNLTFPDDFDHTVCRSRGHSLRAHDLESRICLLEDAGPVIVASFARTKYSKHIQVTGATGLVSAMKGLNTP